MLQHFLYSNILKVKRESSDCLFFLFKGWIELRKNQECNVRQEFFICLLLEIWWEEIVVILYLVFREDSRSELALDPSGHLQYIQILKILFWVFALAHIASCSLKVVFDPDGSSLTTSCLLLQTCLSLQLVLCPSDPFPYQAALASHSLLRFESISFQVKNEHAHALSSLFIQYTSDHCCVLDTGSANTKIHGLWPSPCGVKDNRNVNLKFMIQPCGC